MTEHVHGCLKCRPEMVPDFDPADERYHQWEKCGRLTSVTLNGERQAYSSGAFEGSEGWVLFAGERMEDTHVCPRCYPNDRVGMDLNGPIRVCVEPRFGAVEVAHECPAIAADRRRRIDEDVAAMRSDVAVIRSMAGRL